MFAVEGRADDISPLWVFQGLTQLRPRLGIQ
jgi:hypothetical protein